MSMDARQEGAYAMNAEQGMGNALRIKKARDKYYKELPKKKD